MDSVGWSIGCKKPLGCQLQHLYIITLAWADMDELDKTAARLASIDSDNDTTIACRILQHADTASCLGPAVLVPSYGFG